MSDSTIGQLLVNISGCTAVIQNILLKTPLEIKPSLIILKLINKSFLFCLRHYPTKLLLAHRLIPLQQMALVARRAVRKEGLLVDIS